MTERDVLQNYSKLTEIEKKIFHYLVENPKQIKSQTAKEIAERNFVSKTTVINVAKKCGFQGFSDFKYYLLYHQRESENSNDFLTASKKLQEEVERTFFLTDEKVLSDAANTILHSRLVYIFGLGLSGQIASMLENLLLKIGVKALFVRDSNNIQMIAESGNKEDSVIILSLSGNTGKVVELAQKAKIKGMKLISVTAFTDNAVQSMADIRLYSFAGVADTKTNDTISRVGMHLIICLLTEKMKELCGKMNAEIPAKH